jgi:hypothetical protein
MRLRPHLTQGSIPFYVLKNSCSKAWWHMLVIPAILEMETKGSWNQASLGKVSMKNYLEKKN